MYIDKSKKIVIKIGSSILVDEKGKPKKTWLKEFVKDIKLLINKKKQIVIVSSGAIALGCEYLQISIPLQRNQENRNPTIRMGYRLYGRYRSPKSGRD